MKKTILAAAAVSLMGSLYSQAQSVVTDPVGFVSVTVPAQSDAALGAPLGRANEFQGVIQSVSGTTGSVVITVAGTPGWTASQFVYASGTQSKTYYARIDSGVREGLIGTITANDTSSFTITVPTGDDLVGVLSNAANGTGDNVSIAPYWTLGTLVTGVPNGTKVFTYSTSSVGVNLAPANTYSYNTTVPGWFKGATPSDDVILPPMQGFTVRNSTAGAITVSITGSVPMATHRLIVRMNSTKQDQRIFFNSPVPEYVGNTGLGLAQGDQLLIIDNSTTGFNKANSITLTYNATVAKWFKGGTDVDQVYQLQPGASFILRKAASASSQTTVDSHLQSYLQ